MIRYRPPQKSGAPYITPEGADKLRNELKYLWKVKRPKITQSVSEAAAQGDRSENAEYIYGKKQLREIDGRVRFLSKRLDELQVIESKPADQSKVYFGAWLRLIDLENGGESLYRIVGPDEFNECKEYISIDSPIAKALIGKQRGDEVEVNLPSRSGAFELSEVSYEPLCN